MDLALFLKLARIIGRVYTLETELGASIPRDGISPLQDRLLQSLYLEGPQSLGTLAACAGLLQPNASREIAKLADRGFVVKAAVPGNRRMTQVSLTAAGTDRVEGQFRIMAERLADLLPLADEAEAGRLLEALRTFEDFLAPGRGTTEP